MTKSNPNYLSYHSFIINDFDHTIEPVYIPKTLDSGPVVRTLMFQVRCLMFHTFVGKQHQPKPKADKVGVPSQSDPSVTVISPTLQTY